MSLLTKVRRRQYFPQARPAEAGSVGFESVRTLVQTNKVEPCRWNRATHLDHGYCKLPGTR